MLGHVQFFATPWTAVHQAPLSVEFSRQEYWRGLPFPSPGETWYLFFNQLWPVIPPESSVVNQFNSDWSWEGPQCQGHSTPISHPGSSSLSPCPLDKRRLTECIDHHQHLSYLHAAPTMRQALAKHFTFHLIDSLRQAVRKTWWFLPFHRWWL